jgi:hypothetical protein
MFGVGEVYARGETQPEPSGPPGVIVFEVPTARRVGAQLRYNGGPRLDEIRYAVYRLALAAEPDEPPADD